MSRYDKSTTLCFTGHRKLPTGAARSTLENRLSEEMETAIADGYTTFLFGGAVGWDMLCGITVNLYKKIYPQVRLIAAVPFAGQEAKWTSEEQSYYHSLLSDCDEVVTLCQAYSADCYKIRNQFMVDNASRVIAYYDGSFRSGTGQTVRMAEKQKVQVKNLY